jgi:hypothetical protein
VNTGSLTREHKLLIAAGGNVLFVISMFIDWYGAGNFGVDGMDLLPSSWIFLIFGIAAALAFAAEAFNFELPAPLNGMLLGTYLTSVLVIITIAVFLEGTGGADRKVGLFLALIGSVVGLIGAALAARDGGGHGGRAR